MYSIISAYIGTTSIIWKGMMIGFLPCLFVVTVFSRCVWPVYMLSVVVVKPISPCDFADDIFICIFSDEKFCILIKILLKFGLKGPIDNTQHWFK